jgi:hypothetical protein
MNRTLTTQDISWFLDLHSRGLLNLEPPYQRRSVWSPRDKRFFIDTVLNNYPAPPIFLHKTLDGDGKATYHVVDGKQRLQTIIEFTLDKVRIPDDFSDINLQKQRWKNLDKSAKENFWNYVLIVEMIPDVSDSAIRNIFERINRNSRKLTSQEMRHAKYDGWFIDYVEGEAEKTEWKAFGVVTTARTKRMADVQFLSELFAIVLKQKILGFDQDHLDELYAEYEETSDIALFVEDDFLSEVDRIKNVISELFRLDQNIRNYAKIQSHFYSLWSYIALANKDLHNEVGEFKDNYMQFMSTVMNILSDDTTLKEEDEGSEFAHALQYANNTRGASTDFAQRERRHTALVAALSDVGAADNENS